MGPFVAERTQAPRNVLLVTDSQYVMKASTSGWSTGRSVVGRPRPRNRLKCRLWQLLDEQCNRHDITWSGYVVTSATLATNAPTQLATGA